MDTVALQIQIESLQKENKLLQESLEQIRSTVADSVNPAHVIPWRITLDEACRRYRVNPRDAMRWKKAGKLQERERWEFPSGQKGIIVYENEFYRLVEISRKTPRRLSDTFYHNAIVSHCDPISALRKICSVGDVDLTYCAMRLAMDFQSHFFFHFSSPKIKIYTFKDPALHEPRTLIIEDGGTFAAQVARRIAGTDKFYLRHRTLNDESPGVNDFAEFKREFFKCKELYHSGLAPRRNLVGGTKPRYLADIHCKVIPEWANEPVWPIRQTEKIEQIMRLVETAAAKNPALKAHLENVVHDSLRRQPPTYDPSVDPKEGDLVLKEEIQNLVNTMESFGIEKGIGRRYCHGYSRLVHHDAYTQIKQKGGLEKIPKSVVDRIFGAKTWVSH